jgi:O-antigen/teichoic acid export membrane protein
VQLGVGHGAAGRAALRETAVESWRLGRWVLLTSLVSAGLTHLIPWSLGAAHGTTAVAQFAAVATVLNASNPVLVSVSSLIIPAVAAAARKGGPEGLRDARRVALKYAVEGAALLVPYFVLLVLLPGLALRIFYGHDSHYLELQPELRVFVLGYTLMYVGSVLVTVLNALGVGHAGFVATAAGAVGSAVVAVPLTAAFGIRGAAWGGVVPIVVQLLVAAALLRRVSRTGVIPAAAGPPLPAEPVPTLQGA